jgi:hypothetical protein
MAGLDPAIPLIKARPCPMIGIAGSSPAMTAAEWWALLRANDANQRARLSM